jgi:hypothetical protein
MAQWAGDATRCIEYHAAAVQQARRAGNTPCEITSLCMAAFVKARIGDVAGARDLLREITALEQAAMQPTMMGYIHYAKGGVESSSDPQRAIDEYQASVEWANMAGNHLGAQRVKQLIADLQAIQADPAEALAIHVHRLIDLPTHGAIFYAWSTIRSLLAPLAQLEANENVAVLAGALKASPLKLDRTARSAVNRARDKLGSSEFELAADRGSQFDLEKARTFAIDVLGALERPLRNAEPGGI